ncbi:MAG: methionyl-tRNA formyltransferase [Lachnospiraceae bacterium]|nr:methionyl-tRNA formyltransferase [Lachnospiraceae bacterium]
MRIVFMGTPDFASAALKKLIESGEDVVMAVTQPDRKKGRGKGIAISPVKECASENGIEVFQPERVKEASAVQYIRDRAPELIIVAAFGQILSKEILDIPKYGCINIHASILPKYRGASPIQSCIMAGEKETGVTIMRMDEGLDTGDIILQRSIPIAEDETGGSLFDKLSELGASLMIEAVSDLKEGKTEYTPQDSSKSSYTALLRKNSGRLDFSGEAVELERMIRALDPWPSAWTKYGEKTLKIWKAHVIEDNITGDTAKAGEIISVTKDDFTIKCGNGSLVIEELQQEGKKRMSSHDFLLGMKVKTGDILKGE